MKMQLVGLTIGFVLLGMAGLAQASLTTIGTAQFDGTGTGYNLIWDDDNNGKSLVWLDYSNDSSWTTQNTWAAGLDAAALTLNLDAGYSVTWDDAAWRLPSAGTNPQTGYNQTTSEMGHLFYTELGLQSYPDRGNTPIKTAELNAANFDNLFANRYWSGTEYAPNSDHYAWYFNAYFGDQDISYKADLYYGLAVRSGQVSAVPVPGAIWLLGSGLIGLVGLGRGRKGTCV